MWSLSHEHTGGTDAVVSSYLFLSTCNVFHHICLISDGPPAAGSFHLGRLMLLTVAFVWTMRVSSTGLPDCIGSDLRLPLSGSFSRCTSFRQALSHCSCEPGPGSQTLLSRDEAFSRKPTSPWVLSWVQVMPASRGLCTDCFGCQGLLSTGLCGKHIGWEWRK